MTDHAAPSRFWAILGNKNRDMLAAEGIENFKRTVANNYFNWGVLSIRHGLFADAAKQWIKGPDLIPFLTSLPEMDMMRKQQSNERIHVSWIQRTIYRIYVSLAWSIMTRRDTLALHNRLSEPEIGNPFRVQLGNKLISQDLANSILECNAVVRLSGKMHPLRIAEIGGGYGRLAFVLANAVDCEYTIFDIEPTLSVAKWYIESLGLQNVKLENADAISSYPDGSFDVALSISTLPEMSPDQAEFYLAQMARLSSNIIFLKQWKRWKNPDDGTELSINSYDFGPSWRKILAVLGRPRDSA